MTDTKQITKIHFMGVGGSGMAGAAKLAEHKGFEVTGCDLEESTSYIKNVEKGHSKDHIKDADLVVISPAVLYQSKKSDEYLLAKKENKVMTWQEFAGKFLMQEHSVIAVAGTHGKSTTTAMAGKLLTDAGFDPAVLMGAINKEWDGTSRTGNGKYFLVEADEFNDNFLNYRPEVIILNNIEYDHPDYFKNEEDMFKSFSDFVKKLTGKKMLIANGDDPGVQMLLANNNFGDIEIIRVNTKNSLNNLKLKVIGAHNQKNAAMVLALADMLGIKPGIAVKSLESFGGIGRRLEFIGKNRKGAGIYDDYAHHPTAVKATLVALRESFPKQRIWAVYEPHSYSRTKALLANYAGVFDPADKVLVLPIFKARDSNNFGIKETDIIAAAKHKNALTADFDEAVRQIQTGSKNGDIVLVMGAGYSYKIARRILAGE